MAIRKKTKSRSADRKKNFMRKSASAMVVRATALIYTFKNTTILFAF